MRVLLFVALLTLGGCSSTLPSQYQVENAYYGEPITYVDATELAGKFLTTYLGEYDATWGTIRKGYYFEHARAIHYGYLLDGIINGESYQFVIRDNLVTIVTKGGRRVF